MDREGQNSTTDFKSLIDAQLDRDTFRTQHWEGTFFEYLEIARANPAVARNAYQRVYDAIMDQGSEEYKLFKRDAVRYNFFSDPFDAGADGIFGLDFALMQLVDFFRSAAEGYGTDKRILLLHGPVGSSKSTIARLLKKGIEQYSRTDAGALYSFSWLLSEDCDVQPGENGQAQRTHSFDSPMHQEPLLLIPQQARADVEAA
ncbi:MAG: serine protein kinase, partial [Planctomycetota bacterium]